MSHAPPPKLPPRPARRAPAAPRTLLLNGVPFAQQPDGSWRCTLASGAVVIDGRSLKAAAVLTPTAGSGPVSTWKGAQDGVAGTFSLTFTPDTPPPVLTLPAGFRPFPATDPWNTDVSQMPVDANSATYLASIGLTAPLHPNFGALFNGQPNGMPFNVVDSTQTPPVPISFSLAAESDPGPYPIPASPQIEAGSDAHLLLVDPKAMKLWEVYQAAKTATGWQGGSGAVWDLAKLQSGQRPAGWTSADAAGLPIFPGLVRFDEVQAGAINHALRFTVPHTRRAYLSPANHWASTSTDPALPPMGLRVRLKALVDTSSFSQPAQVICAALKKYGMILADNGSAWFISGEPNDAWNDLQLADLKKLHGSDLEVVNTGATLTQDGSPPPPPPPPPGNGVIYKVILTNDPSFTAIRTAAAGSSILVSGNNFGGAGTVTVAGLPLPVTTWTNTVIVGVLPAVTAPAVGPVTITPAGGTAFASSFAFTVTP